MLVRISPFIQFLALTVALAYSLSSCKSQESLPRTSNAEKFGDVLIHIKAKGFTPPSPIQVRADPEVCGKQRMPETFTLSADGGLQDAVGWVESSRVLGWPEGIETQAEIVTENCQSRPLIVLIPPMGGVRFINKDPILHSIRAQGQRNYPAFRSHPPQLESVLLRFEQPEIVPIYNDLHPWMKSFVVIAPHQNYGLSDKAGNLMIRKIPYGKVQLKIWHPSFGFFPQEKELTIDRSKQELEIEWRPQSDTAD